jgi:hypothetical protein
MNENLLEAVLVVALVVITLLFLNSIHKSVAAHALAALHL